MAGWGLCLLCAQCVSYVGLCVREFVWLFSWGHVCWNILHFSMSLLSLINNDSTGKNDDDNDDDYNSNINSNLLLFINGWTGWPGVLILGLGGMASLICHFCLSVAACRVV